jgi:hypothetical protein
MLMNAVRLAAICALLDAKIFRAAIDAFVPMDLVWPRMDTIANHIPREIVSKINPTKIINLKMKLSCIKPKEYLFYFF